MDTIDPNRGLPHKMALERGASWPPPPARSLQVEAAAQARPAADDTPLEPGQADALAIALHARQRANDAHLLISDMNTDRIRDDEALDVAFHQVSTLFSRTFAGLALLTVLGAVNLVLFAYTILTR